jgi:hypothetical protein
LIFSHQQEIRTQTLDFRFLCIVLAVLCDASHIPPQFKLPVAVAAHGSLEKSVVLPRGWMFHFKTGDIGFAAIKALRMVAPQFCSPPFEPQCALDGTGIFHALVSGVT